MDVSNKNDGTLKDIIFTAGKWQYFKLWVVNMVLSILTLGIYSAWAKVRNTQYIYGHTSIDGVRLEYLAQPLQILKGRIVALLLLLSYIVCTVFFPLFSALISLIIYAVYPLLMVKALRFNLRHTSYRKVRFGFSGSTKSAYFNFLLLPILGTLSLGLAMPWVLFRINQFIYGNLIYGDKKFEISIKCRVFYKAVIISIISFLVPIAVIAPLLWGSFSDNPIILIGSIYASYFIAFLAFSVYAVLIRNHIVNSLEVKDIMSFKSNLGFRRYLWTVLSNLIMIIFSVGLLFPVARIRMLSVLYSATQVVLYPGIEELSSSSNELDSALGEEVSSFFDAGLSLS